MRLAARVVHIKLGTITFACALLILARGTHAQELQVPAIGQVLQKSCADFMAASADLNPGAFITANLPEKGKRLVSDNQEYVQWAFGFISAVNNVITYYVPKNVHRIERLSAPEIDLWLRDYCNNHPNSRFIDAVQAYTKSQTAG